MKEMIRFTTVILLLVICCWAWAPAGDAVLPESFTEIPGTSEAPGTSVPNGSLFSNKDGWIVITVLGIIAAAGAALLILRGNKPKNKNKTIVIPDPDPEKTVRIQKTGPYDCGSCIGQGKRSYQEDSLWFTAQTAPGKPVCAVVADGMGGMDNGAESSSIAREFIRTHVQSIGADPDIPSKLWDISRSINTEVFEANSKKHMNGGTTLVCAYIIDARFYWISIGDSRIYLCRDGMLSAVNEEHELETRLYDMLLDGRITLDELRSIPNRELRKLTSHIGRGTVPVIDQNYAPFTLKSGDRILLCSDGVSGSLSEDEILLCLQGPDADSTCKAIADMIEKKDLRGQDNYAAVVISFKPEDAS